VQIVGRGDRGPGQRGEDVSYVYDGSGRLRTVTDANQCITTDTWDACPTPSAESCTRILSIEDPRNLNYLTNTYDGNGRVDTQTLADGTSTYGFSYTLDNGIVTQTEVTDPRGNKRRVSFNSAGYTTADTGAFGEPEEQAFTYQRQSGTNLLQSMTDALGRAMSLVPESTTNLAGFAIRCTPPGCGSAGDPFHDIRELDIRTGQASL
jgi:hypothetical protein